MVQLSNPLRFGTGLWDPSHRYETSWLVSPYVLGALRTLFGFYGIFVNLFQLGWYCTHPQNWGGCAAASDEFSYFTVLTYWGLAFYNLTAGLHTLTYARTGTPLLDRFPRPLQALHALYYTTVTVYPLIVTAVYWGIIYSGHWFEHEFDAFSNVSQHALNSFFALFEMLVPRTPAPLWIHAWWVVFVLALYLTLAYVTYYTKGFYTYTFLDIQAQGSAVTAGYIVGIAVGSVIIFSLVKGLIWVRLWATERKGGMDGKFARQPMRRVSSRAAGDDDVEMGGYGVESVATGAKSESPVSGTSPHHL